VKQVFLNCGIGEIENSASHSKIFPWIQTSLAPSNLVAPVMEMSLKLSTESFVRIPDFELRAKASAN
jgi:hypothetical protein